MKADVLTDNLKSKLAFAFHAVSTRSQLPVLLNFLIETRDGFLHISSTDLEIGISVKIPAKVEIDGITTVPAKTFFDLISTITEEKITIELKESQLHLSGKRLKTSFPTISAEEFPKILDDKGKKAATIKKESIYDGLSRVALSASLDMGRPALSGVLIKKEGKGLTLVATDGYRLSLKKNFMASLQTDSSDSLLIPARIFKELASIKDQDEDFDFFISDKNNQVIFSTKDLYLVGRLIEAEFPDYQKILPEGFETKAMFDRNEAQNAVKTCSIFAREAANIVKLSVGKGKVSFSSSASSVGENTVEIEAKTEGEENEIAFNARYLLDFLGTIDEGGIEFQMTGPLNPGLFKTQNDKDFIHIIMPIRVQE